MKRLLTLAIFLGIVAALFGWFLSAPSFVNENRFANLEGDAGNGEQVFYMGGCSSCHATKGAKDSAILELVGGQHFKTAFGTFIAPNISPDETHGIGAWTKVDFANAMLKGVSPQGKHYYPAFPFTSYQRMTDADIVDLYAFMMTLPKLATPSEPHDVGFPFNIRRGLGLWKSAFMKSGPIAEPSDDAIISRGQYLVEGAGHCGECHTARNLVGGSAFGAWLAGGPNPDGPGFIPNITPHETGLAAWSVDEIVEYLTSGFTPEFDSVGGSMVSVVENTEKIKAEDRQAIAAYLKSLPAIAENR